MKNIVDKVKSGVKSIMKLVAPVAVGLTLYTTDVEAQNQRYKSSYEKHDRGAKFRPYKSNSTDIIEEKVFYDHVTKSDDRFYVQHLDNVESKRYENDLDIAFLPFENSYGLMGLESSNVKTIVGERTYYPIHQGRKKIILDSHVPNRCPDQIILIENGYDPEKYTVMQAREIANRLRGDNYISRSYVRDYLSRLTKNNILELGDGREFFVLTLPKEERKERFTDQILIEMKDHNYWSYDPVTKNPFLLVDVYRGVLQIGNDSLPSSVMIDGKTGLVSRLENVESEKVIEQIQKKMKENEKKGTSYLIFGINGNHEVFHERPLEYFKVNLGFQKGPFALIGSYGQLLENELIKDKTINPNPKTGRYFHFNEINQNVKSLGLQAEIHFFNKKPISPYIGGGINAWNFIPQYTEKLFDKQGNLLDQKKFDGKNSWDFSWKVNGGVNFGKGKFKIGPQISYDSRLNNVVIGVRASIGGRK